VILQILDPENRGFPWILAAGGISRKVAHDRIWRMDNSHRRKDTS